MSTIAERIDVVRERIARACARAGRDAAGVTLIAVTKGHGADAIIEAHRAGVRDFGENRVQEAEPKIVAVRATCAGARWHLVGHLQTNKVARALGCFDILHSVDSLRLAEAISSRANGRMPVLLEVNMGEEAAKSGAPSASGRCRAWSCAG
jgi:pyridoxal phosphate enzyme (YggS family)